MKSKEVLLLKKLIKKEIKLMILDEFFTENSALCWILIFNIKIFNSRQDFI